MTNPKDDLIQRLRFVQSQGGGYYELAQDCIDLIESMAAVGLRQETEIEGLHNIAGHAVALLETKHVDEALKVLRLQNEPGAHTTEENFQHFLAYSNLKVDEHALRWAFYAGKDEPPPEKSSERAPEVCGCPYGQCHCDDGSERTGGSHD